MRRSIVPYGLLMIIPVIVYAPAIPGDFVYDDVALTVVENPALTGEATWLEVLQWDRPLREFTYALDHCLWGLNPVGYHLQNLVWHLACGFLLLHFLRFVGFSFWSSYTVVFLFLLHPINSESVAWISGRKELLCLFFEILTCYLFLLFLQQQQSQGAYTKLFVLLSLVSAICAYLSKQVAVVLPFLLVLSAWLYRRDHLFRDYKSMLFAWLPHLLLLFIILFSRYNLLEELNLVGVRRTFYDPAARDVSYTFLSAVLTPLAIFFRFVTLCLFPLDLTVERAFEPVQTFADPRWIGGVFTFLVIGFVVIRYHKQQPFLLFGLLWFFLTWLPVSGALPVGYLLADRYLYIPCVGYSIALVSLGNWIINKWGHKRSHLSLYLCVLLALFYSIRSFDRSWDWRDEITLWESAIESRPNYAKAYVALGDSYSREGMYEKAYSAWQRALELEPDLPQVWVNMANAEKRQDHFEKAEEYYKKALDLFPEYGLAHFNLALLYDRQEKFQQAIEHLHLAVKHIYGRRNENRRRGLAHYHLARIYHKMGQPSNAAMHLKRAEKLASQFAPIYVLKGFLASEGSPQARDNFAQAIRLDPTYAEAYFNLGVWEWFYGSPERAENLWEKASHLDESLQSRIHEIKEARPSQSN